MNLTDADLLRRFVADESEAAFAEVVRRHLNLVYSVACRHLGSTAEAEDVAQQVFIELARQAGTLPSHIPLVAWLHVVSRRQALNHRRAALRRRAREASASEEMKTDPVSWAAIEPALDEAVETLDPRDRAALLLRFFENQSLREVGAALGLSDDAAQKRVSRALEELRTFFRRRGVAVSAVALAADLPLHGLHPAPAGLAVKIACQFATLSSTAGGTAAALKTTETLVMTSLQKSLLATALAATLGAGIYEATVLRAQAAALRETRTATAAVHAEFATLRAASAASTSRLATIERQIDTRLQAASTPAADPALEAQAREWLVQLERLKQAFVRWPALDTPALRLLRDQDWFDVAAAQPLESDADLRRATSELRRTADGRVAARLQRALASWLASHDRQPPAQPSDLAPLCDPPLDPAIFSNYEMISSPRPGMNAMIATKTPIDPEWDDFTTIGPSGYGGGSAMSENVREAQRRYAETNNGQRATTAVQLQPFLKWTVSLEALQRYMSPGGAR